MSDPTRAGVYVPVDLTAGAEEAGLGFVLRSPESSSHPEQVGFPGGKHEPEDATLRETAVRETVEEVGLARTGFSLDRELDPHRTRSGDFDVVPFLGRVDAPERFVPDSLEVTETFWASVPDLRAGYEMDGDRLRYHAAGHEIWGLTARIVTTVLLTDAVAVLADA